MRSCRSRVFGQRAVAIAIVLAVACMQLTEAAPAGRCPRGTLHTRGTYCVCPASHPVCTGSRCMNGRYKTSRQVIQGFSSACTDCECVEGDVHKDGAAKGLVNPATGKSEADYKDVQFWDDGKREPRVLIMTVATHREPFIDLVEKSVREAGYDLYVAGIDEFFKGYGWKLKKVRETLLQKQYDYDIVLFIDSFDTFLFGSVGELVAKFRSFKAPMVVSAEVNLWPNPDLAPHMPPSSKTGHYPYPNSGSYIGYVGYILHLYSDVIAIHHKSDCCDDQGELIKAVALDPTAFAIDHEAVIFQTLFGRAKNDVIVRNGRPFNQATGTQPSVIHANGWDKQPLLDLLAQSNRLTEQEASQLAEQKAALEKQQTLIKREDDINDRCKDYNPNPSMDPERNFIAEYGLLPKLPILRSQLEKQAGVDWHQIEQQIYEVQEYRTHCPPLPRHIDPHSSFHGSSILDRPCNEFKVYVYPATDREIEYMPPIYRRVRQTILEGPYATEDPDEACLFVPNVDVSCWCENCMYGAYQSEIEKMHPVSYDTTQALAKLAHWEQGRNHIIFEYSDAPCIPFDVGYGIVAKVGMSEFHTRNGLDISMPLFSMVEFTDAQRRVPASQRKYLLTFRGTKSARSDAMRNHLPRLHNGRDIVLVCACRWFGEKNMGKLAQGYDTSCAEAEEEFKKYTYTELALNTKFGLIVEGFGYHSFRLTEVMAAGAIPVIIVDHYALPYQDLLDWESFSVRVPEHRMMEIPDILARISPEQVRRMQERVVFVYEHFLKSFSYQIYTALESARINLFTDDRDEQRKILLEHGFSYQLPLWMDVTPKDVHQDSINCNTPAHRRKQASDNAPM